MTTNSPNSPSPLVPPPRRQPQQQPQPQKLPTWDHKALPEAPRREPLKSTKTLPRKLSQNNHQTPKNRDPDLPPDFDPDDPSMENWQKLFDTLDNPEATFSLKFDLQAALQRSIEYNNKLSSLQSQLGSEASGKPSNSTPQTPTTPMYAAAVLGRNDSETSHDRYTNEFRTALMQPRTAPASAPEADPNTAYAYSYAAYGRAPGDAHNHLGPGGALKKKASGFLKPFRKAST